MQFISTNKNSKVLCKRTTVIFKCTLFSPFTDFSCKIVSLLLTSRSKVFLGKLVHSQLVYLFPIVCRGQAVGRVETESGGTRRRTGGEVKGKEANGVGNQQSSA